MNARQWKWSEFMSEYDFGIYYIKGKENVVVDALSRRPRVFSLVPLKVNLREHVLTQLHGDSWYLKVTSNLQSGRQLDPKYEGYSLEVDGLLRYRGRMYIPEGGDIRSIILKEAHRALYCAHLGVKKMYDRYEEALLLGRHEARCSPFRRQVPRVSTSESQPPSPGRSPTTT
jgi:hypothetical protein